MVASKEMLLPLGVGTLVGTIENAGGGHSRPFKNFKRAPGCQGSEPVLHKFHVTLTSLPCWTNPSDVLLKVAPCCLPACSSALATELDTASSTSTRSAGNSFCISASDKASGETCGTLPPNIPPLPGGTPHYLLN